MKGFMPIVVDGVTFNHSINQHGVIIHTETKRVRRPSIDKDGYERVTLYKDGIIKNFIIHRLVGLMFIPNMNVKKYDQINHKDGNKRNNTATNLEYCDSQMNIDHAFETGLRCNYGTNSNLNKYNEDKIKTICGLLEKGYQNQYIAKAVGVSKTLVGDIKRGLCWVRISRQYTMPSFIKRPPDDIVRDICILIESGRTNLEISRIIDVAPSYVSQIRSRKRRNSIYTKVQQLGEEEVQRLSKDILSKYIQ